MKDLAKESGLEPGPEAIREQLNLLVQDPAFRSSKRSVQFLTYVVEQTLGGAADQIKERTIGVEVFGREPSYDTNVDHVVRTAAIELRKRLATYYDEERHRHEPRVSLVPGSYIPRFSFPPMAVATVESPAEHPASAAAAEAELRAESVVAPAAIDEAVKRWRVGWSIAALLVVCVVGTVVARAWMRPGNAQELFWQPILDTPGAVLLGVGDVPNGPPTTSMEAADEGTAIPIVHKATAPVVPFGDALTIGRVMGTLESHGKKVIVRREGASSFSDLREGPVVLIGAFNNEWSLRLTRQLRYTLALDADKHLVYIHDAKNAGSRSWSWATDRPVDAQGGAGKPALQDFALISRIWNSETGHMVVVVGGLYTFGTEAAGEFLNDPKLMEAVSRTALEDSHRNLQIVLGTTVTDGTPGPPRLLAVSTE